MKKTSIRELKHDTSTVLSWVAAGESVEVCRHNVPVAVLSPAPLATPDAPRPDFRGRLNDIYGNMSLEVTGTEIISDERGSR